MFKSKLTAISLALFAIIGLSACDKTSTSTAGQTSETTAAQTADPNLKTYVALTDPNYPPFEFKNEQGAIDGMEIEIFNAIAKDQKFNVTYTAHGWDGIFAKLNEPHAELIVSAVGITEEAKAGALLSDPYYVTPYRLVALDKSKLNNWEGLPRIAISENEDSAVDLPERYGIKNEQLVKYSSVFLALTALLKNEADIVVADSTVLQYNMGSETLAQYSGQFASKTLPAGEGSNLVFAVDKGHPDLLKKINAGLANIKASGELANILNKYNQNLDISVTE